MSTEEKLELKHLQRWYIDADMWFAKLKENADKYVNNQNPTDNDIYTKLIHITTDYVSKVSTRDITLTKTDIRINQFLRLVDMDDFISWMRSNKFQYYFVVTDKYGLSALSKLYTLTRINTREENEGW